jgi:ADP-ribose pyrophosphatase YjhB (NUDIX family)
VRDLNYCVRCGGPLEWRQAFGATRPVCTQCGRVHFIDPKVAVGLLAADGGRLLLIQRANDPERGKWSIPAGFVDAGEDPARAAEREGLEETGLRFEVTGLLDVYARGGAAEGADILIVYQARATGGALHPGDDAAQARYFAPDELPELAFVSTQQVIERWLATTAGAHGTDDPIR